MRDTGHAYSVETLPSEFNQQTKETLWSAIRSIEEGALLMRRMACQLKEGKQVEASAALERAGRVREVVLQHEKHAREENCTRWRLRNYGAMIPLRTA